MLCILLDKMKSSNRGRTHLDPDTLVHDIQGGKFLKLNVQYFLNKQIDFSFNGLEKIGITVGTFRSQDEDHYEFSVLSMRISFGGRHFSKSEKLVVVLVLRSKGL